jgi:hypothetical protein
MQLKLGGVLRKILFIAVACTGSLLWATPALTLVISPLADDPTVFRLDVAGSAGLVMDEGAQAGSLWLDGDAFADYGTNTTTNLVFGGQTVSYFGTLGPNWLNFVLDSETGLAGYNIYSFATDYSLGAAASGYEATFVPGTYAITAGSGIFGDDASGTLTILDTPVSTAVPEPATYAAMAGVMALGFGVWRRRRA